MRYLSVQLTFQEVPDEISLCFLITGCQLKCPGCHSPESWNAKVGIDLTLEYFDSLLEQYRAALTCVCFLGGEWHEEKLIELCARAQAKGLKTCLYTGLEGVPPEIKKNLNYLKVGPYLRERGGLSSPNTNQSFFDLKTNQRLNFKFNAHGGQNGQADGHSKTR